MYLGAATNNLAATTLDFFQEAVETFGFPLRYISVGTGCQILSNLLVIFTLSKLHD